MSAAPRLLPRIPGAESSLAGDLARGKAAAWKLLGPGAGGALGERTPAERARRHPDGETPDVLSIAGASTPAAAEKLRRILGGEGMLVTTGQQPLLFLGPLFVVYKLLGASALAEALEKRFRFPVLPLFWVAADDHDWEEVGRVRVLDLENTLRTLRIRPPVDREGRAVGPSLLPETIEERREELLGLLPDSEFVDGCRRILRDSYRPGRSFSEGFIRALAGVLGEREWAWLDSGAPRVGRAASALYRRVVEEADAVEEALLGGARRVREAGYTPQVTSEPGGLPLFVDGPDGRSRLLRAGKDEYRIGREGETMRGDEVGRILRDEPDLFSPNVSLRPVLESWLLPVGATLLGPGELAYWSQLGELFRWASVPTPVVRTRPSWVVVEEKIGKVLAKIDAGPEEFAGGAEAVVRRHTAEERPPGVADAIRAVRRALGRSFDRLDEAVGEELPGIRSAAGAARHEASEAVGRFEKTVDDRVRERHEVVGAQIRKAAAHLYPGGDPQERVVSPFYYLARYGSSFVDRVEEATRERAPGLLDPVAEAEGPE